MQIVIKISEEDYERLKYYEKAPFCSLTSRTYEAIANGIPLPKHHGRLIDADELKKEYPHNTDWDYPVNTNCYVVESIDNSPTIIDTDKAESEE